MSAAASIAQRVNPWGESVPWKSEYYDSPRNGSGSDTAERPPKPSAPTQMTLGAYES